MEQADQPAKAGLNDGLNPLPEWALIIAAQCWYEPTTSMIELDSRLALVFAEKLAAERERCAAVCEGVREAADHAARDGHRKAGAMASAATCAKLIRA